MAELTTRAELEALLRGVRTIAVLGASAAPSRAGHYVPAYLASQGYRIFPVNPVGVGQVWWGEPVRATLADVPCAIDLVDVFRRTDDLVGHLPELLALRPAPRAVWLQLGLRHRAFAEALVAAGIDVVQDRCTLADHQAWRLPAVGPPRG